MSKQSIKTTIDDNIYQNNEGRITGIVMNSVLKAMVDNEYEEIDGLSLKMVEIAHNEDDVDLTFEDEDENVCMEIAQGEVRTGNFDSRDTPKTDNILDPTNVGAKTPIYAISDSNGYHVLEIGEDGHIRTKNFDSSRGGEGGSTSHPLKGKTLVCIGDSQVGQCANLDINIKERLPLESVYRCGFSGCNMAWRNDAYQYYCMYNIANCIATGDYSSMDDNLDNIGTSYKNLFIPSINKLKSVDWGDGDNIIVTIQFGGNDYRMNTPIGEVNTFNTHTMKGATEYVIKTLIEAMPKLTIIFVGQPYRVITYEGTTIITDSDGKANTLGLYRVDYQDACGEVASANHIPFFDMYRRSGRNKYNAFEIGSDGCHPTSAFGQKKTAELYCLILTTF